MLTFCLNDCCCWQSFCKEEGIANDQSPHITAFIALYDYDPYQSSPNDQPDIELPLSAGEHVFVTGDIDVVRKRFHMAAVFSINYFYFDNVYILTSYVFK